MPQQLEGVVDYIQYPKYFTKTMEWAVLHVKTSDGKVKVVGETVPVKRGEVFLFEGDFVTTKYGKEFRFTSANRSDQGEAGAKAYLAHLFGPKTADKIIKKFGTAEEGLQVFKEDPMLLIDIKGISAKTVKKAQKKQEHHQVVEVLFTTLRAYGMTMHNALKVYKKYGNDAIEKLTENPYQLMDDFEGFGFDKCDLIATHFDVSVTHPKRIEAGIFQVMKQSLLNGHTFTSYTLLKKQAERILNTRGKVAEVHITQTIAQLVNQKRLVSEVGDRMYLPSYYDYEKGVAKHLKRLLAEKRMSAREIFNQITAFEQQTGMKLARQQSQAVITSTQNLLSVVTGPPGSGKTTIITAILHVLQSFSAKSLRIGLAAPTGKAAKRMSEATGLSALTIHKLLGYKPQDGKWEFDYTEDNLLPYDVLVLDEVSMLDLPLAYHLLQAIPKGCTVILVGDKDQLPSVGAGQVLADILASERIPVTYLTEVYRQKNGSTILERAVNLSKGRVPELTDSHDFTFFDHDELLEIQEEMVKAYHKAVLDYGLDEVTILSPMWKSELGIHELNKVMQDELNPKHPTKVEVKFGKTIYRRGDKVMQKTNNEEHGVVNGMIGYVYDYLPEDPVLGTDEMLLVNFDGEMKEYTRDRFDEIELAYAMSIHKSQGSEWKVILMPIVEDHAFMLQRRLIYTGWTRAKERLHCFGSREELKKGIIQNIERPRNSLLQERIKGIIAS